ncbi:MAG: ABC transporter ATP-binding protein [Paracoccaceae bacterium]
MTLTVSDLSVTDGTRTLVAGVSLSVEPGQVTAVIGANGAGKSELVLALAGMLPISAGTITLNGQPLKPTPESVRRAGIAAVPEGHRVLTTLSVDDNLRAAGTLLGPKSKDQLAQVYTIFPELAERKAQIAGTMSGGQQQMLALGHALMCAPRYLLIDEMSLGLAPLVVKRLLSVVTKLKSEGVGILLIEQFTDLALSIAETAVILRSGKMRYSGPAQALVDDKTLLQSAYFGV